MRDAELDTTILLQRWYAGDAVALDRLVEEQLPWIRQRVRQRLGDRLRRKLDSGDVVQDALLRFLHDGPRLQIRNAGHLRGILARIVENVLRDKADWFTAKRRALARERPLEGNGAALLDLARGGPATRIADDELHERLRLALELLEPDARRVLVMRVWEGLPFADIAEQLDLSLKAADARYRRAVARLAVALAEVEQLERDAGDAHHGGEPAPPGEIP